MYLQALLELDVSFLLSSPSFSLSLFFKYNKHLDGNPAMYFTIWSIGTLNIFTLHIQNHKLTRGTLIEHLQFDCLYTQVDIRHLND